MASKPEVNKLPEENALDDVRFLLYKRGCYVDQLVRLFCDYKGYGMNSATAKQPPEPLFDCLIVVGLQNDEENGGVYKPFIKMQYPKQSEDLPHGIEMFCFPDAHYWSPDSASVLDNADLEESSISRTYILILTDLQGNRRFGYCRRIVPEGDSVPLPLAYCIISSRRSRIYPKILEELEAQHGCDDETTQELVRLLYAQSFPKTVNEPIFICHSGKLIKQIRRPLDTRLEENPIHMLANLGIESVVKVFTALLFEKKVLVLGSSLAKISAVVESLSSLLTPFEWQHTLIPLLPSHLMNIIEAPTPYIIGAHDCCTGCCEHTISLETINDIDDCIVAHLDHYDQPILRHVAVVDEDAILPTSLIEALKERLRVVEVLSEEESSSSPDLLNVMISEAFTKFFLPLIADWGHFIKIHPREGTPVFRTEHFVENQSDELKPFMRRFCKTAMFQAFIEKKIKSIPPYKTGSTSGRRKKKMMAEVRDTTSKRKESYPSLLLGKWSRGCTNPREEHEYDSDESESDPPSTASSEVAATSKLPKSMKYSRRAATSGHVVNEKNPRPRVDSISFNVSEVTIKVSGRVNKFVQIPTRYTISQLCHEVLPPNTKLRTGSDNVGTRVLIDNAIPSSPNATIGDIYQIFKKPDGLVHVTMY